eukprot:TRINITY_DN7430_c0_g1_i1.p1 TRINITY_DN7430_c0_g1~~TRINITY_DN7430_c0_g1_i1.p1  ORF type:complete len:527 (+),score=60.41 TRINITY_DN7430_c0_g1_i1:86-1666(+)
MPPLNRSTAPAAPRPAVPQQGASRPKATGVSPKAKATSPHPKATAHLGAQRGLGQRGGAGPSSGPVAAAPAYATTDFSPSLNSQSSDVSRRSHVRDFVRPERFSNKVASFCGKLVSSIALGSAVVWYWVEYDQGRLPFVKNGFVCSSDLQVLGTKSMPAKGLAIDDTSVNCMESMPTKWPLTGDKVKAIRLFRSVQQDWQEAEALEFANSISKFAHVNDVKVLVGTQITCSEAHDDTDWKHTRTLLQLLGPEHVLGLAVGNELDQLSGAGHGADTECIKRIWSGGYLLQKMRDRIAELRSMHGFEDTPVTSVFTADILYNTQGKPFKDTWNAQVNTFYKKVLETGPDNFIFTLNFYPYFDPNLPGADQSSKCDAALRQTSCFDNAQCLNVLQMDLAQERLAQITTGARFWVGELGWSAPRADTLHTLMKNCDEFSSYNSLYEYYKNFLQWDLRLPTHRPAPEIVFYFAARDAQNFGNQEYFGLIESCSDSQCKLTQNKLNTSLLARKDGANTETGSVLSRSSTIAI